MELQIAIEQRRSIRNFKDENISDEIILKLIDSARLSPSSKNRQPWKFYIARGQLKQDIVNLMREWQTKNKDIRTSVIGTATAIEQAPFLILVFKDSNSLSERSDTLSLGAAIEHILLKATELNLGSLWIADTYYVKEKISKLVNTKLELYSAVAIGIANESPAARPRKDLKEIILD